MTGLTVRLILAYESLCLSVPVPLLVHVHVHALCAARRTVVVIVEGDDGTISAAPMALPVPLQYCRWIMMGRRVPRARPCLRPPIAAVYPPQGKLHGNRPQDRSDRHIGRHDTNLALRSSKSLAKSLRRLEWPARHTNARSAARGHPRPKPGLSSRHDSLRQTAHRQRHTGKMKNRQRAPRRRQRQRRTEGDARPQKEGGIPEAEMIAKVSSGSSAKSLTQADRAQGLKGPRAGHLAGGSPSGWCGCLGEVWMSC